MQNIGKLSRKLWEHFWSNMKTFQKVLYMDNHKGLRLMRITCMMGPCMSWLCGSCVTKTFYWKLPWKFCKTFKNFQKLKEHLSWQVNFQSLVPLVPGGPRPITEVIEPKNLVVWHLHSLHKLGVLALSFAFIGLRPDGWGRWKRQASRWGWSRSFDWCAVLGSKPGSVRIV